jgi:hypothetical protein
MNDKDRYEQYRKEALARGAIEVGNDIPSQGFDDEPMFADLDPELEKQVAEAEDRAHNAKPSQALQECVEAAKSENIDASRKYRFLHQSDYDEKAWDKGKVMWIGKFLCELQKIRPDAFLAETSYMGLRGLGFMQDGKPVYSGTSVQNGNAPEWELLRVDQHGMPKNSKYRGWRTVLLACIKGGFITEEQCSEVFGKPIGDRSRPWYRELFIIRNNRCPECEKRVCICSDHWDYLRSDNHAYEVPPDVQAGRRQIVEPEPSRIYVP